MVKHTNFAGRQVHTPVGAIILLCLGCALPQEAVGYDCEQPGCPEAGFSCWCCSWTQQKCTGATGAECTCGKTDCPKTTTCKHCSKAKGGGVGSCKGKPKSCSQEGCQDRKCNATICPTALCKNKSGAFTHPCATGTRECVGESTCGSVYYTLDCQASDRCCLNRTCGGQTCASSNVYTGAQCFISCASGTFSELYHCRCCYECRGSSVNAGTPTSCGANCSCCRDNNGHSECADAGGCGYN